MLRKTSLWIVLLALALGACAPAAAPAPEPGMFDRGAEAQSGFGGSAAPEAEAFYAARDAVAPAAAPLAGSPASAGVDRLVIKNVSLSLVVKDPAAAADAVTALAEGLGGFVVSSNVYQASVDAAGNKIMQANVSIRVPVERLNEALAQLKALSVTGKAESENVSGEDVTAQYTDLESQLRNLEAAEAQLQEIMTGARRTEDVLAVYNQLVSVRGQIEQVKGQMKYYRESAAMSLISVSLLPDALSQPIEVGGWKAEGVAKEALEALLRAFQGIAGALIWLGIFVLPLGLLFGVPLWLIGRAALRRARKPKTTTA